jgi:hypothetical protein
MEVLGPPFQRFRATVRYLAVLGLLFWGQPKASAVEHREYAVKAVFLFNFTLFTTWPAESFGARTSPLVIGVFGEDPFGSLLDKAVAGEAPKGRSIVILRFSSVEDVRQCHIVFVPATQAGRAASVLAAARGRSILTVGEEPDFLAAGGMVALVRDGTKVRLRFNLPAIRAGRLEVSSKLLRLGATP